MTKGHKFKSSHWQNIGHVGYVKYKVHSLQVYIKYKCSFRD